jgi:tyrosyl-tRNA synthetase
MSKSLGNAIGIEEPAAQIYGKLMSIPDRLMWSYYDLLTDLSPEEIGKLRRAVEEGTANPRDVKGELARRITSDFHGPDAASRAEEDFRRAFSKGELPEEIETREAPSDPGTAARTLVAVGLAASMREARRKIAEGALSIYPAEGTPREGRDPEERLASKEATVLRLGRRFVRVVWT